MIPIRTRHAFLAAVLLPCLAASAGAQTTSLESVSSEGGQGDLDSTRPTLSLDGRFVAFHSLATNLVPGGSSNGFRDVYVHDHLTGETERISFTPGGGEPNGPSLDPSISADADGRYVAFYSDATDLVANDTNGVRDVFLHDRETGTTVRVSVDASGQQADGESGGAVNGLGRWPSVSADGSLVAFHSRATNLVPGGTNGLVQVFVKDLKTGAVTLASPAAGGTGANGDSSLPALSPDGAFVAFQSAADDLIAGDTNGFDDVFVYELSTGQVERVSVSSSGVQGNLASGSPAISNGGAVVAFQSAATDLVAGDANGQWDAFARDRTAGTTELVSLSSTQQQGDGPSGAPTVSADGRLVAFMSEASTFDPGDTNGVYDAYLRDRVDQTTVRLSLSSTGATPDERSEVPFISADGSRIAFQSPSEDLVPHDLNGAWDVFLRDPSLDCSTTVATYCTASTTSIPGCQAAIQGVGIPKLCPPGLPQGFWIVADPTPGQATGICLFGVNGPAAIPFGTQGGLICVKPPVLRSVAQSSGGTAGACDGVLHFNLEHLLYAHPNALAVGETVHAQVWFRDPASPDGFGLSDALWFQLCPEDQNCVPCSPGTCGG